LLSNKLSGSLNKNATTWLTGTPSSFTWVPIVFSNLGTGHLGATVMPDNLYLHSSLLQNRKIGKEREDIRQAIRWNSIDSA
jgi:Mn2+/Fe2+ NRAMP family transporter